MRYTGRDMNEFAPLPHSFFTPSASQVAARLLGHWLVRFSPEGISGGVIVETEAYLEGDPACHAFRGPTDRNRAMFGPGGVAYVYFIYGCHFCVNAVCNAVGKGEAVLVRAIEPVFGLELIRQSRSATRRVEQLANGPGKLCTALNIARDLNNADLCAAATPLMIAVNPEWRAYRREYGPVVRAARIGIAKAADLPLRFYLGKSGFVSRGGKPTGRQTSAGE